MKVSNNDFLSASDALAIVMPAMPHPKDNYHWSLCDLSTRALWRLEENLHALWSLGWGRKPVVIMEQFQGFLSSDNPQKACEKYWGGSNCVDGYRKSFFRENFLFPTGASCLLIDELSREVYYYRDNEELNDPPFSTPCADYWH